MPGPRAPHIFTGTYARDGRAGLYPLLVDGTGWRLGSPFAALPNSSFAAFDPARAMGYFVDERPGGLLRLCRWNGGGWQTLGHYPTGGDEPCYVALSPGGTRAAVANYASGSLALYTLDRAGVPQGTPWLWQGEGRGPHPERQAGPHIHCTIFDGEGRLYAVDLGTDRILAFDLAADGTAAPPTIAYQATPGSGPRHLVLHPRLPVAYLVSELASTLTVLDRVGSGFATRLVHRIQPHDYGGDNLGGHLSLSGDGTRLYVSNRGHDSIAAFAIDAAGDLALLQHAPSHGASPRCFALLEAHGLCVVANEAAETIAVLALDRAGLLGEVQAVLPLPGAAFPFVIG